MDNNQITLLDMHCFETKSHLYGIINPSIVNQRLRRVKSPDGRFSPPSQANLIALTVPPTASLASLRSIPDSKSSSYGVCTCLICASTARTALRSSVLVEVRPTRPEPFRNAWSRTTSSDSTGISGNCVQSSWREREASLASRSCTALAREEAVSDADSYTEAWISAGTRRPRVRFPALFCCHSVSQSVRQQTASRDSRRLHRPPAELLWSGFDSDG